MMDQRLTEVGVVDEKQLKLLMRDWRRGRADRNLWQALSDGYVMVFSIVVIGAMMVSSILQAQQTAAIGWVQANLFDDLTGENAVFPEP